MEFVKIVPMLTEITDHDFVFEIVAPSIPGKIDIITILDIRPDHVQLSCGQNSIFFHNKSTLLNCILKVN